MSASWYLGKAESDHTVQLCQLCPKQAKRNSNSRFFKKRFPAESKSHFYVSNWSLFTTKWRMVIGWQRQMADDDWLIVDDRDKVWMTLLCGDIHLQEENYPQMIDYFHDCRGWLRRSRDATSVTRLGDLLHFGQLLKAVATIILPKLPTF